MRCPSALHDKKHQAQSRLKIKQGGLLKFHEARAGFNLEHTLLFCKGPEALYEVSLFVRGTGRKAKGSTENVWRTGRGGISSAVPPNRTVYFTTALKYSSSPSQCQIAAAVQEFGSIRRNASACQFSIYQMSRANKDFPTISTVSVFDFAINLITPCL